MKNTIPFAIALCISIVSFIYPQNSKVQDVVDILIVNGTVVTMDANNTILDSGVIAIKNSKIVMVESKHQFQQRKLKAKKTIDAAGKVIMPGLINTHTHAAMTLFRGLADDLPLDEWLENYIWPAEAKYMNAQTVRLGTLLAITEMIHSGITTFNDMYFFEDEVAQVVQESGIRAVLGEAILDFPTPNSKTPEEGLKYTAWLIEKWKNNPLITISVAPHSTYTCSSEVLKETGKIADQYGTRLHIHLSETQKEVKEIKEKYRLTPVQYLDSLGVLGNNTVAAHCVYLTEKDIQVLSKNNAGVAHNPTSNMKLASGVAPVPEILAAGITTGLGTDGAASNNTLDIFKEMDAASKLQKVVRLDPTVMKAEAVLRMATIGGARVLGLDDEIGSIEAAKRADIIIIDFNIPHLTPVYNIYSHLVYAAKSTDVESVIIEGKLIMEKHKILTVDEQDIINEVRLFQKKLIKESSKL